MVTEIFSWQVSNELLGRQTASYPLSLFVSWDECVERKEIKTYC